MFTAGCIKQGVRVAHRVATLRTRSSIHKGFKNIQSLIIKEIKGKYRKFVGWILNGIHMKFSL